MLGWKNLAGWKEQQVRDVAEMKGEAGAPTKREQDEILISMLHS